MFAEGTNNLGATTKSTGKKVKVEKGDQIILAIDARNGDHGCDLTDIDLTITDDFPMAQAIVIISAIPIKSGER